METAILFKQHYIMSRSVQKFRFSDCDWLGFDLDHTLVRYRLHALLSLIFHSLSRFLVLHLKDFSSSSSHYPEELANVPYDQDFAAKGIVVDLDKGNFLKLNYKKRIVRAYHGLRKMDQDEIIRSYPEGIVQEFHDEPTERFKPLITFFDIPAIFLMALLVQRIDSGTCGNVSDYHQAWKDVISGFHFCFGDFQQGEYFEALRQDISRYVYKRPDVKNWLLKLRGNGIRLFLATNSHLDYADLLLKYSFGEDWRTLFDLTIVDSRKPIFFNSRTPFFCVDYESLKELDSVAPTESIQLGSIVARGNWKDLEDVFLSIDKQQKKDIHTKSLNYPLVVYFGDRKSLISFAIIQY